MFSLTDRLQDWGWLGAATIALDAVAVARALYRGHGVTSTLAWIFGILAFPGVGAGAYLLLANPSIRRTVRKKIARASRAAHGPRRVAGPLIRDHHRIVALTEELTGLKATTGNRVDLMVEDDSAFGRIEKALADARQSIWAEYYIVRNDETGHRFLDLLAAKAREGVSVYLLYDAVGSMGLDSKRLHALRAAGGKVASFLPVNPLRQRWAVHLRNHRKLIVVDGVKVFTGGMNVGDEYSGRSRLKGRQHFRDSHLIIEGPAVRHFAEVFAEDWRFAVDEDLVGPEEGPCAGESIVCPLPSGPDQRPNASAHTFFAGIARARKHSYLTTPYFAPDESTITALVTAAKSGVDVRILLPAHCDVPLVGPAARSFYPELLRGGVRIFEFKPSMLHAKTMSVDGEWGIIGSANVDMRSFRLNFEIGAVVLDPRVAGQLDELFLRELDSSDEVTAADLERIGVGRRIAQNTARLLAPLL